MHTQQPSSDDVLWCLELINVNVNVGWCMHRGYSCYTPWLLQFVMTMRRTSMSNQREMRPRMICSLKDRLKRLTTIYAFCDGFLLALCEYSVRIRAAS